MNHKKLIKKIRKQYGPLILIGLMMISATMSGIFIGFAYGENYVANLTKNETDQILISELCYAGVDIGECDLLYGGIDTHYGDRIK